MRVIFPTLHVGGEVSSRRIKGAFIAMVNPYGLIFRIKGAHSHFHTPWHNFWSQNYLHLHLPHHTIPISPIQTRTPLFLRDSHNFRFLDSEEIWVTSGATAEFKSMAASSSAMEEASDAKEEALDAVKEFLSTLGYLS